jgi:hypothetical protein
VREPYPTDLVPLLPQFLTRRRAKADFPLRAMERYGLDRPAYYFAMDFGNLDPDGVTPAAIGNVHYRTTDEVWRGAAVAASGAGLLEERDGRWSLTEKGREALAELRSALDAHYAALAPLPAGDLERLATLLDQAYASGQAATEPALRDHRHRAARYRWREPGSAFARLDAAVYGLWQVRDDCHVQAWRDAGLRGPVLDILTRLWRHEAASEAELTAKLPAQRPADVTAGLAELRGRGLVGDGLALTAAGTSLRERIEAETDRYFFGPWPEAVGAEAAWIADRLAAVNAALA